MRHHKLSRRALLGSLGCTAVLLPGLPSIGFGQQAGAPPPRLAIFYSLNGIADEGFWPSATPTAQAAPGVYSSQLSSISGPISRVFGSEFDSLRSKFSIVRGMGLAVSPYGSDNIVHDAPSVMALSHIRENQDSYGNDGPKVGSSLDCIVENSSGFYPNTPLLRAIRVSGGSSKWPFSFWRPNGGTEPPQTEVTTLEFKDDDPEALFQQVLGSVMPTTPAEPEPVPALPPAYRVKAFDSLLSQFQALSASPALSAVDRERLQSHVGMLNDLKARALGTIPGASGSGCSPNVLTSGTRVIDRWTNNLNTIAAAFACNVSRISCYIMDHFDDDGSVSWDTDHTNSHAALDGDVIANSANWRGWQAKRIAYFMSRLDSMQDADGSSVLDNTIVIWANQHGGGHCISNYPIVIGGGAGKFRMGEYLDYRLRTNGPPGDRTVGRPLTNLWMAVMRALGVPAEEYLRQGEDGAFGQAPRSGDDFGAKYGPNLATMRRELIPYFYTGSA